MTAFTTSWNTYQPRPLHIEAVKMPHPFVVRTLEGRMEGQAGDYLVEGTHGEFYPVRADIFEHKYESVEGLVRIPESGLERWRRAQDALGPEPEPEPFFPVEEGAKTNSLPTCLFLEGTGKDCGEEAVWKAYWLGRPTHDPLFACEEHLTHVVAQTPEAKTKVIMLERITT